MIRSGRSSGPLQLTILLLVLYIVHLHWTTRNSESPRQNAPKKIVLSTEKKDWSGSREKGPDTMSIFQRPVYSQPDGMRIVIATMNTQETTYDKISLSNKFGYAQKHNYGIKLDLESAASAAVWHKLNMIEYLIRTEEYDWIWWLDYDTVITNTTVKLEDIIAESLKDAASPHEIDLILTADCWPLNAGSMLIRSSQRMLGFLSAVWECGSGSGKTPDVPRPSEQDCIRDMLLKAPMSKTYQSRAIWIPQTKINAFPKEVPCWDKDKRGWKPGDFVVHFAGAWAYLPKELKRDSYGVLMRKYSEWIDKTALNGAEDWQELGKGHQPVALVWVLEDDDEKKKESANKEKATRRRV